jgi:hypothetical protein
MTLSNNNTPFPPSPSYFLYLSALFIFLIFVSPQDTKGQSNSLPFADGEQLSYRVSYNWEFLWVDAGKVEFKVSTQCRDNQRLWHFQSWGRSLKAYDLIYKVRDSFESLAGLDTFEPAWYHRKTLEGSYTANNQLYFQPDKEIIISETQNSRHPKSIDTLAFYEGVFDLQTAVYYARTFDFDKMQAGVKIPLRVIVDGEVYDLAGLYQGNENVELHDGRIFECYHFTVELVAGTIFKAGERASIWVSADKNRVPVLIEAQILIGSVKAWLNNTNNLKYPQTALID